MGKTRHDEDSRIYPEWSGFKEQGGIKMYRNKGYC